MASRQLPRTALLLVKRRAQRRRCSRRREYRGAEDGAAWTNGMRRAAVCGVMGIRGRIFPRRDDRRVFKLALRELEWRSGRNVFGKQVGMFRGGLLVFSPGNFWFWENLYFFTI